MPSKSTALTPKLQKELSHLGDGIRAHRKGLKISAVAVAEAAGISRMTLNRIEHGEGSVTMGAYLSVAAVLGLNIRLGDGRSNKTKLSSDDFKIPMRIRLSDYPQLKEVAWQLKATTEVTPKEAFSLYERNWRHLDLNKMNTQERDLLQCLLRRFGRRKSLV